LFRVSLDARVHCGALTGVVDNVTNITNRKKFATANKGRFNRDRKSSHDLNRLLAIGFQFIRPWYL
jgi:hypothetical protein